MAAQSRGRTKVFISYSHEDVAWLERLRVHLKPLEREGLIEVWYDTQIKPGARWREEIGQALAAAKVAVLLVSADFLASDFIASEELPRLLSAAEKDGAIILPFILSASRFEKTQSLSQFQAVNDPSKPLIGLNRTEQEVEFVKLVEVIVASLGHSSGTMAGQRTAGEPLRIDESKGQAKRTRLTKPRAAVLTLLIVGVLLIAWFVFSPDSESLPTGTSPSAAEHLRARGGGESIKAVPQSTRLPQSPPQMVYVPGGEFMMGRNDESESEQPAHKVMVRPFFIDVHEVTREGYKKFLDAMPGRPAPPGWSDRNYPEGTARQPVTGVTWDDANAYARWAGKRLPTEEEWEFAARGTDGRRYPWGDEWKPGLANAAGATRGLAEVGAFVGASPFGALDMVGNAWEWTASDMRAYPGGGLPDEPPHNTRAYRDGCVPQVPSHRERKVIRGGTYESDTNHATTTFRAGWLARCGWTYEQTGFRCVKDAAE